MKPLIDGDVLRYEIGFCGEFRNEEGELVAREFDFVRELLDNKIKDIGAAVWATEPPILFLTMDYRTKKRHNRRKEKQLKRIEKKLRQVPKEQVAEVKAEARAIEASMEHKPNFREEVAKKKVYKGQRKGSKPMHYDNLTEYMLANYECVMAEGLEADDLLSIYQTDGLRSGNNGTIICSRDKDLRITPGFHYGWECGRQREFGPTNVTQLGELSVYRGDDAKIRKVEGTGINFFAYQLLVGDTVDNIPGLAGVGPTGAVAALEGLDSEESLLAKVASMYRDKYGDSWESELLEQGRLLWMVRELDDEGKPVMWEIPECCYGGV